MGVLSNKPDEGGIAYTQSDHDLFRRLSDFSSIRRTLGEAEAPLVGPRSFANPSEACRYTDADARAFENLTKALEQVRPVRGGVRSATRPKRAAWQYSPDDQRHFDDLMADDRLRKAFDEARPSAVADSERQRETVHYAERDLSAFEKLSPDSARSPAHMNPSLGSLQSRRDRKVERIRIVDADAEREKIKRRSRLNSTTLKIKYFD